MRNYEAGVLFIPTFFGEEYLTIRDTENIKKGKLFPIMFNIPLVPYEEVDTPFHTMSDDED